MIRKIINVGTVIGAEDDTDLLAVHKLVLQHLTRFVTPEQDVEFDIPYAILVLPISVCKQYWLADLQS
jgi:hypothetical protein